MSTKLIFITLLLCFLLIPFFSRSFAISPDAIEVFEQSSVADSTTVLVENSRDEVSFPRPWWQWVLFVLLIAFVFIMFIHKLTNGQISLIINKIVNRKIQKSLSGSNAIQLINKAYNEIEKQNFDKAKNLLEESFKADNKIPEGHSEYSFVMSTFGYLDLAIDHMIKAALLKPHEPKFWSNLAYQYYLDKQFLKAMTSTFIAEIVNPSYSSIAKSKQMINQAYQGYNTNTIKCKNRAEQIWKAINNTNDDLPPQSGDINQLMNPTNNFFL